MKAIQAADRGGYDALRLVDIPRPRAGQALVRITSAGVTPPDWDCTKLLTSSTATTSDAEATSNWAPAAGCFPALDDKVSTHRSGQV